MCPKLKVKKGKVVRDHSLNTYAKSSEKLIFLIPYYAHIPVLIRGLKIFVFPESFPYVRKE